LPFFFKVCAVGRESNAVEIAEVASVIRRFRRRRRHGPAGRATAARSRRWSACAVLRIAERG